jgi:hypothetical protein
MKEDPTSAPSATSLYASRVGSTALCIAQVLLLLMSLSTAARAQQASQPEVAPAPAAPSGETLSFDGQGKPAPASADPARELRIQALTREVIGLEQRARAIEAERAAIRQTGFRIGKYISWAVFGVLASTALSQWGRAESVSEAIDDGRTDKAYDVDGDGDVDHDDEQRARRIARGLLISSLVPLGLGVYTTVIGRMRGRAVNRLSRDLDDLRDKRRSVIDRLGVEVGVSGSQAALKLRLTF